MFVLLLASLLLVLVAVLGSPVRDSQVEQIRPGLSVYRAYGRGRSIQTTDSARNSAVAQQPVTKAVSTSTTTPSEASPAHHESGTKAATTDPPPSAEATGSPAEQAAAPTTETSTLEQPTTQAVPAESDPTEATQLQSDSAEAGVGHRENDPTEAALKEELNPTEAALQEELNPTEAALQEELDPTEVALQEELDQTEAAVQEPITAGIATDVEEEVTTTQASLTVGPDRESFTNIAPEQSVSEGDTPAHAVTVLPQVTVEAQPEITDADLTEAAAVAETETPQAAPVAENQFPQVALTAEAENPQTALTAEAETPQTALTAEAETPQAAAVAEAGGSGGEMVHANLTVTTVDSAVARVQESGEEEAAAPHAELAAIPVAEIRLTEGSTDAGIEGSSSAPTEGNTAVLGALPAVAAAETAGRLAVVRSSERLSGDPADPVIHDVTGAEESASGDVIGEDLTETNLASEEANRANNVLNILS